MRRIKSLGLILLCVLIAAGADAQPAPSADQFSLTVYSTADPARFDPQALPGGARLPGFAMVRELRKISLVQGENKVKFDGVASSIDPTTVSFKSITAPDSTAVISQTYEYDLVSPDKLLEKYVGKNIIVNRKLEPLPNDRTRMPESIEAKLLSFTADQLVLLTNNKQLPIQMIPRNGDISEIKLFDLQGGLTAKPTLGWKISAQQAGEHHVLVSYQTGGITWRADYTLILNADQTLGDLSCWATLVNRSGADFPHAAIKLIAGDVHRIGHGPRPLAGRAFAAKAAAPREKAFSEYHLYTLTHPVTLANDVIKQIGLFAPRNNVPITRRYVYAQNGFPRFGETPIVDRAPMPADHHAVNVFFHLKNSEAGNLGIPLPAGRVRLYQRDADDAGLDPAGSLEFIGEDAIGHTPKDAPVVIQAGSAFDLTGDRKQTALSVEGKTITESFEIKLHNHKKDPVHITVKETLYRWSTWQIVEASDQYEKTSAQTIEFSVPVPANQEKTITYTVKYTW